MTAQFNPFLRAESRADAKGGMWTIEDPRTVENIVFQTRGGALDSFEDELAGQLMTVFGSGAERLEDVVAALNTVGSRDRSGAEWNDQSFREQMVESGAALFAVSPGVM